MSDIELNNFASRSSLMGKGKAVTQSQLCLERTDIHADEGDGGGTRALLPGDEYEVVASGFREGGNIFSSKFPRGTWDVDGRNIIYGPPAKNCSLQLDSKFTTTPDSQHLPTSEDEDLVTVPVAKLQQLVEYGIQVLKESRQKTVLDKFDLEHNAARPERSPVLSSDPTGSEAPQQKDFPKHLNEFLTRARANPWPLRKIELVCDQAIDLGCWGDSFNRFDRPKFDMIWEHHFRSFFGYGQPSVSATEMVRKGWFWIRILKECDREMIPWLLEIGTDDPDARAATLIKILICIAQESKQKKCPTTSTIGAILERCYSAGVLSQPEDDPLDSENVRFHTEISQDYGIHIVLIAISLNVFNDCLREDDSNLGPDSRQILWSPTDLLRDACGCASLEHILAFQGPELVVSILYLSRTSRSPILSERPSSNAGRIDDLNIESLRTIGGLRIVWTDTFEEHLLLDHQNKCLRIARLRPFIWGRLSIFQDDWIRWSDIYRQSQELSVLKELKADIEKTWAIIFSITTLGENSKNRSRIREKLKEEYATVIDKDQNSVKTYDIQTLKDYHIPWIEDDFATDKSERVQSYYQSRRDNLVDVIKSKHERSTIAYSNFGMFEDRVRELRQYMDNQKPHGLRQLLRDSRDALNYYTFMGVIIFGTLSILLAFASLAVSIAQTYASFKALGVSP